jgi:hypothetical protein
VTRVIRYAFHPRSGEEAVVVGRQRYCGEPAYVGRQPDGSLALVPIWMTEEPAAALALVKAPRLSLSCLRDLRREIDACLSLLDGDSRRAGESHAAKTVQFCPTGSVRGTDPAARTSQRHPSAPPATDRGVAEGSGEEGQGGGS